MKNAGTGNANLTEQWSGEDMTSTDECAAPGARIHL